MSLLGDMSYNFGSVSSEFAIFSLLEFVCYLVLSLSFTQLYIFLLLGSSKCSQEVIPLSWTVMLMPCYRVASGNRILLPSGCAALTHTCVATTGQTPKRENSLRLNKQCSLLLRQGSYGRHTHSRLEA